MPAHTIHTLPVEAIESAITMYERGATVPEIAKHYGLSERTAYRRLSENPAWKPAIEAKAQQAYDQALREHQEASDELRRLRERLDEEGIVEAQERVWRLAHVRSREQAADRAVKRAQWELERVCARIYSQKQEVTHVGTQINVDLGPAASELLRHIRGREIEGESHIISTVEQQAIDSKEM